MNGTGPILCAHLLRSVDGKLIDLLRSLSSDDWDLQTVAPQWRPASLAAHVIIPQQTAWRISTRGIDRQSEREQVQLKGDHQLAARALELTSVIA